MITNMPTDTTFEQWKKTYEKYKNKLKPNRISGEKLLEYLESSYCLEEIFDKDALDVVSDNVLMNDIYKEKLPQDTLPSPRCFYIENKGKGQKFYLPRNKDAFEIWGGEIERIFVGIDVVSGFYTAEGSTMLHDELGAIRGLDEKDLQNYVVVAQYIEALKRFDMLDKIVNE